MKVLYKMGIDELAKMAIEKINSMTLEDLKKKFLEHGYDPEFYELCEVPISALDIKHIPCYEISLKNQTNRFALENNDITAA